MADPPNNNAVIACEELIESIKAEAWLTAPFTEKKTIDPRVLSAMSKIPRDEFVQEEDRAFAYENRPLPINFGQTISQPFIVALMTDVLCPDKDSIILEIGTGSGYQTAILAELVKKIYSVEIVVPLAEQARKRLLSSGYQNVEIISGDGYVGWPECAPYDGMLVTSAVTEIPSQFIEQLKPGGRLVVPVGLPNSEQELILLQKTPSGKIIRESLLAVSFGFMVRK